MALTDTKVRSAKPEDNANPLSDGDGLFLLVHANGSKYWRFRFRFGGKQHVMAFGVYPEVSLADARKKREEAKKLVASGNRQHRPALELKRIPELLQKIDGYTGRPLTRWATELTLLIFIRSSELRFARWSEIDFETSMWTIPPEREPIPGVKHSHRGSKMHTPHLVPLSKQAQEILKQIKQFCGEHELIFIGDHDPRKPMSENTVNSALRVMGYDTKVEVCGHGFRTMACSSLIKSGL
ncbi:DUF4102 domain-containing protein [Salmonella enterica subsp. enterica]|nr:DUF4102 domain-containing protein [Salmonella enterica subsp. enterica]